MNISKTISYIALGIVTIAGLGACSSQPAVKGPEAQAVAKALPTVAQANMTTAKDEKIGDVTFTQVAEGVKVQAHFSGLKPKSKFGFHIHAGSECVKPDFKSAGDHFNPTNEKHGALHAHAHHMGDMGNVTSDAKGGGSLELTIAGATLSQGANALIGHSVILHANADDLKSQPSGNAGPRFACGAIAEAK